MDATSIQAIGRLYRQFEGAESAIAHLGIFIGRRLAAVRDAYGEAEALAVASQAGIPNSRAAAFLAAAGEAARVGGEFET